MKKIFEKHGVLRCIAAFMDIVALILFSIQNKRKKRESAHF